MKIVIRADASIYIGTGHIMRCLVLAEELSRKGHNVRFVCRPQNGDLLGLIQQRGFDVLACVVQDHRQVPQHSADYAAWLQVSEEDDACSFLNLVHSCDLVIVDHYAIGPAWEVMVKHALDCPLMVFDDLERKHDCDMLLDQTLNRDDSRYRVNVPQACNLFLGCDYAPLNPFFAKVREHVLGQSINLEERHSLLITMGGSDMLNATGHVLQTLIPNLDKFKCVTVVLNPRAPHYKSVSVLATQYPQICLLSFVENMAELMAAHSLAIGAPGTTSWERACLGIPSVIIPLADNQKDIAHQLVSNGAAILVPFENINSALLSAIEQLSDNFSNYRAANLKICDGHGVFRLAGHIQGLFNGTDKVSLRRAGRHDIRQVYDWQCRPETRRYALNPEIPSWKSHQHWMNNKLDQSDNYFYIVEQTLPSGQSTAVGVVRLDRQEEASYMLSIFVAPEFYGRNIASQALNCLDDVHPYIHITAIVLEANLASQRLFIKSGYCQISSEQFERAPLMR